MSGWSVVLIFRIYILSHSSYAGCLNTDNLPQPENNYDDWLRTSEWDEPLFFIKVKFDKFLLLKGVEYVHCPWDVFSMVKHVTSNGKTAVLLIEVRVE